MRLLRKRKWARCGEKIRMYVRMQDLDGKDHDYESWTFAWEDRDVWHGGSTGKSRDNGIVVGGEHNVCDKLRGIGEKKECSSPWVNAETHGREPLEAIDESNMVDEIRDSWANWYRPSSTFRVSIYTRRPIVRTASYALILKTYRSFNLTKK